MTRKELKRHKILRGIAGQWDDCQNDSMACILNALERKIEIKGGKDSCVIIKKCTDNQHISLRV